MPSHRFSRTASRKNRHSALLVLLAIPTIASAQISQEVSTSVISGNLAISIVVSGPDSDRLFANLDDGLTARMEFSIRVLETRRSPLSIFGPRVLREFTVTYDGFWDPFLKRYAIRTHDGTLYTFRDSQAMWAFFVSLPDFRIPMSAVVPQELPDDHEITIETRSTYHPVVFVAGLSILSLFPGESVQHSGWVRRDLGDAQ